MWADTFFRLMSIQLVDQAFNKIVFLGLKNASSWDDVSSKPLMIIYDRF